MIWIATGRNVAAFAVHARAFFGGCASDAVASAPAVAAYVVHAMTALTFVS